ncbi:hypothetical protein [Ramlibacter humi]|uniref:Uncharacterized protein n=1 Tax=Ramlibacter humi TaxID=2530451 RepID=A0A4Z0BB64_9BURK|nr:hypothetical protein [Ramlibacter humi]TFY96345.1 hypothetical protein EZ216_20625 [Ramlibacter humi]
MSLELPILRIGLAGFSLEQQEQLGQMLPAASPNGLTWEFARFGESDAVWIHGSRSQVLGDGMLRVASGIPSGRSVQINLAEVDRPVAFAQPLPRHLEAELTFDLARPESVDEVVERLENWLKPLVAQFCLASEILEQESALGAGVYHVSGAGGLVAVVDLRGEVGVLPSASPLDIENAIWTPRPRDASAIPSHFVRCSLSKLMWQYAVRTTRDVLPRRYRTDVLYFRRPPRLPQRMLRDAHLLLLRELSVEPGNFADLQQRTGLVGAQLAQALAALYLVGAITSNAKRASQSGFRRETGPESLLQHSSPSGLLGHESSPQGLRPRPQDMTAPAPLSLE